MKDKIDRNLAELEKTPYEKQGGMGCGLCPSLHPPTSARSVGFFSTDDGTFFSAVEGESEKVGGHPLGTALIAPCQRAPAKDWETKAEFGDMVIEEDAYVFRSETGRRHRARRRADDFMIGQSPDWAVVVRGVTPTASGWLNLSVLRLTAGRQLKRSYSLGFSVAESRASRNEDWGWLGYHPGVQEWVLEVVLTWARDHGRPGCVVEVPCPPTPPDKPRARNKPRARKRDKPRLPTPPGRLKPEKEEEFLSGVRRAWVAGRPLGRAPQSGERYAVRSLMALVPGMQRARARRIVDDLIERKLIADEVYDSRAKMRGLRVM